MNRRNKQTANWQLTPLLAHYLEWTRSKTRQRLYRDAPRKKIPRLLRGKRRLATFRLIAKELNNLVWWESKFGAHRVLKGDPAGWGHMRLALSFEEWMLRILRYEYTRGRPEGRSVHVPVLLGGQLYRCFAQAVALRHDRVADWCGQAMVSEMRGPTGFLGGWEETPFYPLMAWLYWTWREGGLPMNPGRLRYLGVYRPLVEGWEDDRAFHKALLRACDYHCARSDPDVDDANGEFWYGCLDVFPAEILALMRIRRELLGAEVTVNHPLMDSPCAAVPDNIAVLTDPLVRRVADRVRPLERRLLRKGSASEAGAD